MQVPTGSSLAGNSLLDDAAGDMTEKVAASLSALVGDKVDAHSQRNRRSKTKWSVQPGKESGVEISSPLMPTSKVLDATEQLSSWMSQNGMHTADGDYLTVSPHVSGLSDKLDPVKLVLFLDPQGGATAFARQNRTLTPSQIEVIIHKVKSTGRMPSSADGFNKAALTYLGKRPDGHTNLERLEDGLIELKVAGGAGYEHDAEAIAKRVNRISNAVETASHHGIEKGEYVKRLATLLNPGGDAVLVPTSDMKVPDELMRFYRHEPEVAIAWKNFQKASESGSGRDEALVLVNILSRTAKNRNSSLDPTELRFARQVIRQAAVHGTDADKFFGNDHATRIKFKRDFGV